MTENEISSKIIGAAIEAHKVLGPGLMESAYQTALRREFALRRIQADFELELPVVYKDASCEKGYRLDALVEGKVIVELKSVDVLHDVHLAQILTYLKLTGHKLGLLINFNVAILKDGIRRVVNRL